MAPLFTITRIKKGITVLRRCGWKEFITRTSRILFASAEPLLQLFVAPLAVIKLMIFRNRKRDVSAEEITRFAFNRFFGLIRPMQRPEEMLALLAIIQKKSPAAVLEIGTASGGTLFLFASVVARDAILVSIDMPGGRFGGGYPYWKKFLYKLFARRGQILHLLRRDSHETETLNMVKRLMGGRRIDFLFIDGDHSYEGVKKDFEMYFPLVRAGGIAVLNDIVEGRPDYVGGVPRFWKEIKSAYRTEEIIKDRSQECWGFGIIYV